MRYPNSHWQKVADIYHDGTVSKAEMTGGKSEQTVRAQRLQNHFPDTTQRTINEWVQTCKKKGLL